MYIHAHDILVCAKHIDQIMMTKITILCVGHINATNNSCGIISYDTFKYHYHSVPCVEHKVCNNNCCLTSHANHICHLI